MKTNHVSFTINKRMLLLCSDWSVVSTYPSTQAFLIGLGDGGGGAATPSLSV
jgi:hypothetical protein